MHVFLVMALVLIGSTLFARADDDVAAGQTVIRFQEEAFARDDAEAAYNFAAPSIQSVFRTPETFMHMVRSGEARSTGIAVSSSARPNLSMAKSCRQSTSSMPRVRPGKRFIT